MLIKIVGALVLVVVLAMLFSLPVYLLWNALLPALFGFKTITWLQALGLSILSGLLFKEQRLVVGVE